MNVLLVNGSPHKNGCVFTSLSEVAKGLSEGGVDSEIFHIGNRPVQGCIACYSCGTKGECVFHDPVFDSLVAKVKACDGIVIGSPVYYAAPAGALCALLDRLFFSSGKYLKGKCAAAVVNCRRGGASAAFDRLNKYFTILEMPVVSSRYWNSTHGTTPDEVRQDLEGMQVMRVLGRNMAFMLKNLEGKQRPAPEQRVGTNFIR